MDFDRVWLNSEDEDTDGLEWALREIQWVAALLVRWIHLKESKHAFIL